MLIKLKWSTEKARNFLVENMNESSRQNLEVDKLKEFDPVSQRSLDAIDNIIITPINYNASYKDNIEDKDQTDSEAVRSGD